MRQFGDGRVSFDLFQVIEKGSTPLLLSVFGAVLLDEFSESAFVLYHSRYPRCWLLTPCTRLLPKLRRLTQPHIVPC